MGKNGFSSSQGCLHHCVVLHGLHSNLNPIRVRKTNSLLLLQEAQASPYGWATMHSHVKEVGILISNHTMREGDRGVVIIGSSVDLGERVLPLSLSLLFVPKPVILSFATDLPACRQNIQERECMH